MIEDYFLISYRNVKRRKLRAFLTLIGIMIAIATIFVLISISLGLSGAIEEQFRELGTDKIFIQPKGQLGAPGTGGAVTLTNEDVDVIEKISGVKSVATFVVATGQVEYNNEIRFVNVAGLDPDSVELFFESAGYHITDGRGLRRSDGKDLVIGSQYKYNNFMKRPVEPGDTLLLNGEEFKVRGILSSAGSPPDDRQIYMNEDEFRDFFNISDRIDTIVVQADSGQDMNLLAERIEKKLRNSRDVDKDNQDFTLMTPEQLLETFGTVLNVITAFLLGIAGISLLVGGIGIANTTFTSVLERTKEIGIMKAVGAKNTDILLIFIIESGLLGLVGGLAGVIAGFGVSKAIAYIAGVQLGVGILQAASPPYLIFGCLAFSFLIGAVSGIWPSWRASRIRPVDALRYE